MFDYRTTTTGDFIVSNGQLEFVDTETEAVKQDLLFRLQTDDFDYQPQRDLGVGLHQFIGQPSTESLYTAVQQKIMRRLTRDDKFPSNSLKIEVVPISISELAIFIFHVPRTSPDNRGVVTVEVVLDLTVGTITPITG